MEKEMMINLIDYIFSNDKVLKCNKIIINQNAIEFTVETNYSNSDETYKVIRRN